MRTPVDPSGEKITLFNLEEDKPALLSFQQALRHKK